MDSPYKQYLGTNYSPTADEAKGIQRVVDATAHELVALDAQIDEVRRQLDTLQKKRSTIYEFGEQHRELLSPARKLTPDILEDIFLACLPSDRNPCMSASEAPMLLTQICSSWRQIAMSAPRFWAAIHIVLPNVNLEPYPAGNEVARQQAQVYRALKRREIAVSEWLGRSGVCPLSISMYEVLPWIGDDTAGANASTLKDLQDLHLSFIVNTILPYSQQWHELDICIGEDTLDAVLDIGLKAGSLKSLTSFHVTRKSIYYHSESPKHQWKDVVALLPPHATSATFSDFLVCSSDFPSIPLHAWQGLTELNLTLSYDVSQVSAMNINIANFAAEVLFHCHALVTLTLYIDSFELAGNESTDTIVLPRVTTLSISLPPSSDGVAFTKRLFLPSLSEMSAQLSRYSYSVDVSKEILGTLLLSGGNVDTLNLCSPRWMNTTDDLVHILKMAPDIKRLAISTKEIHRKWDHPIAYPATQSYVRNVVTDNLLQALSPFDDDIICPLLEEFVCSPDLITSITENGLKDFLKVRKLDPSVASIRHISVFINQLKKETVPEEERISLDMDSTVSFKRSKPVSLSPFEGYQSDPKFIIPPVPIEVYTEL